MLGLLAVAAAAGAIFALSYLVRGRELLHRIRRASKRRGWALDLRLALLALFTLGWIAIRAGTMLTVANVAVHAVGALATRQPLPAALAATAQLGLPAGVVTLGLQQHVLSASQGGAILLAALVTIALCPAGIALLVRTRATAPTAEQP